MGACISDMVLLTPKTFSAFLTNKYIPLHAYNTTVKIRIFMSVHLLDPIPFFLKYSGNILYNQGSSLELHIVFRYHLFSLLQLGTISHSFIFLKFEDYRPTILENIPQFGLVWFFFVMVVYLGKNQKWYCILLIDY